MQDSPDIPKQIPQSETHKSISPPEPHQSLSKPVEYTPHNESTRISHAFLDKEKTGFGEKLKNILKNAVPDFLTYLGIPSLATGVTLGLRETARETYDKIADPLLSVSRLKEFFSIDVIQKLNEFGFNALQLPQKLMEVPMQSLGLFAPGAATAVGLAIGWNSVKEGSGKQKALFLGGKIAEFATAAAAVINPGLAFLYPVAKAFSIGASFLNRPHHA